MAESFLSSAASRWVSADDVCPGFQVCVILSRRIEVIRIFHPGFASVMDQDAENTDVQRCTVGIIYGKYLIIGTYFRTAVSVFKKLLRPGIALQPRIGRKPGEGRLIEPSLQVGQIVVIKLMVAKHHPVETKGIQYIYHLFAPDAFSLVFQGADHRRTDEVAGQYGKGVGVFGQQLLPDGGHTGQSARVVGERWRYFVHIVHLEELYFDNPVVGSACRRLFAGITGKKGCYQEEEKNPGCFHCRFLLVLQH
ncbi:MAG: hypothetical protein IPK76_12755 [Lewinellaceae bacterium]|nr:hypothetical protein [Lewinellaceae bacterium]